MHATAPSKVAGPSAGDPQALAALRRRTTRRLFGGVSLGTTGFFVALAVGPLAAEEITGVATWSGLPGAAGTIGTAAGAALITAVMERRGRRDGLLTGYLVGAFGAALAAAAVGAGIFLLLLVASLLVGVAQGANQLSRYVAAELQPPERRGRALGWLVWAGTVGGVVGPSLLSPGGRFATATGLAELAGPYVVALVAFVGVLAAEALLLRPDPGTIAHRDPGTPPDGATEPVTPAPLASDVPGASEARDADRQTVARRQVRTAVTVLMAGQVVMVLLMTMTPVFIRNAGGSLTTVGLILSAHLVGMYLFAPVFGWADDRYGPVPVIAAGIGLLAGAGLLAASAPAGGIAMGIALGMLGLGWSGGFVAGSSLLTRGVAEERRARLQGRVESLVWASSAVAALSAGVLAGTVGFRIMCLIGVGLTLVPAVVTLRWHTNNRRGADQSSTWVPISNTRPEGSPK